MKRIYITTILTLLFIAVFAQTAEIIDHNDNIINEGDTVTYYSEDIELAEHILEFKVKNTSTGTLSYSVRQTTVEMVGNASRYFCFAGSCYPASSNLSNTTLTLDADETSNLADFSTHYKPYAFVGGSPETYPGTSRVAYTVFDESNPTDSIYFIVKYTVIDITSIENNTNNAKIGNAYPNPAKDYFFIEYSFNNTRKAKIELMNVLGSIVLSQNLNTTDSRTKINISHLDAGVYFYNVLVDGIRVESKKLVIK